MFGHLGERCSVIQVNEWGEERIADRAEGQVGVRIAAGRLRRCIAGEAPPFVLAACKKQQWRGVASRRRLLQQLPAQQQCNPFQAVQPVSNSWSSKTVLSLALPLCRR